MAQDKNTLLAILDEQGRQFMDSFSRNGLKRSPPDHFANVRNVKPRRDTSDDDEAKEEDEDEDGELEWTGFLSDDDDIPEEKENSSG
jgi:hypothetical protein